MLLSCHPNKSKKSPTETYNDSAQNHHGELMSTSSSEAQMVKGVSGRKKRNRKAEASPEVFRVPEGQKQI